MTNFTSLPGSDDGTVSAPKDTKAARELLAEAFRSERGAFIPLLLNALKKHPDIAAAFAWLHAHERRDADDNDAMVMLAALLEGPMFSPAQRRRSAKAAAGELQKALWDKSVPDDAKIHVLPLLTMAGQPVDDAAAGKFFQDYDWAMRRQSLAFAKGLSDSPESFTKLLLAQGIITDEEYAENISVSREAASELLTFGHRIAPHNPAGATVMTAALIFRASASDFSHEHAPGQLDDIHALATPRARWCLETLANWPGFAMPLRDKAARLTAELAGRGIVSQAPPVPGGFSHGIVSMADGMGSRTATLFHRTQKGGLDAFNMMLNDEVGVKDANAFFGEGSEMERMLRSTSHEMSLADAPLPLVRELLADALALHGELGSAPPGRLFSLMAYFGNEPVTPRKREPNLGAYMLEAIRPTPELVAGGAELADSTLFGCLFPASDAAYAFCENHWDKRKKSLRAADFPAFLQEIMPLERERLLRRMAVNLETEALAGRAGSKENQTAARLWLGMRENVAPFWSIPFVQALAESAIEHIAGDLRRGFKNQRDAFAEEGMATLDPETALAGMLQQLFGDAGSSDFPPSEFMEILSARKAKPRGKSKAKKKSAQRGWVYVGSPEEKTKAPASEKLIDKPPRSIYRLAVEIIGYPPTVDAFMQTHPGIVREIEIAGDQTLDRLHIAIFKAFEREDMHAYEFQFSYKPFDPAAPRYVHSMLMDDDPGDGSMHDAMDTLLDEADLKKGQTFLYWFDFGDDWWHRITVLDIAPPAPRKRYPRLAAKRGVSPPQYPTE